MDGPTGDVCFSASSFWVLSGVTTTLITCISTLFGLLMLSYRSRIKVAEAREADAYDDRDRAVTERNEALWRLDRTRSQYRDFAEETRTYIPGPTSRQPQRRVRDRGDS